MEISLKPLSRFRGPLLWDRIGQFDAACPAGHATASAALQRLNRVQASNRFYAATRELGRALKTEFVLQYMSEPQLRATVRRGLLKVEQLHALARAVYYGQAREISRIAAAPDFPFDPDLLRHVSPIEWKNVILYGEIKIDPAKLKRREPSRVFQHESGRYPVFMAASCHGLPYADGVSESAR